MTDSVSLREHLEALREADLRAVQAAFEAAKEKSAMHNDLIRAMERQQDTFVTKGTIYAAVIAAVAVASLVATLLGKIT